MTTGQTPQPPLLPTSGARPSQAGIPVPPPLHTPARRLRPAANWELISILRQAAADSRKVRVVGGDSKSVMAGADVDLAVDVVSTAFLGGAPIVHRDGRCGRLGAGTNIRKLQRDLMSSGLMLAFEPIDFGPVSGLEPGRGTLAGAFSANIAGARGLVSGPPGASLVAARMIDGSGREFDAGGPAKLSASITVPSGVPSLLHSSRPFTPSSAVK